MKETTWNQSNASQWFCFLSSFCHCRFSQGERQWVFSHLEARKGSIQDVIDNEYVMWLFGLLAICTNEGCSKTTLLKLPNIIWKIKRDKFWKSEASSEKSKDLISKITHSRKEYNGQILEIKKGIEKSNSSYFVNQTLAAKSKPQNIFHFDQRENIKTKENKTRSKRSKFYKWDSSNTRPHRP